MVYMSYMATDIQSTGFWIIIIALAIWELIWKGIELWKAARKDQNYWFIAMLILNTAGILPILYIFFFQEGEKGL